MTTDRSIHEHITELVAEEKALRDQLSAGTISQGEEHQRLGALEVELDQAWDLLRQRKARSEFGESPDDAAERPASVVENYLD